MFKRVLAGLISSGILVIIYKNQSSEQSKGFWLGVLATILTEILLAGLIMSIYLTKKAKMTKLNVNYGNIQTSDLNDSKSSVIIDGPQDDLQEVPSDLESESSQSSNHLSQEDGKHDEPSLRAKIQTYRNRADLYFKKVKDNYFHDQKLPLCKLEKKLMQSRLTALSNILDLYGQHFTSLSKAYQQIGQIGLLQKLSNEYSQMEPYDELHVHQVSQMELSMSISRHGQDQQQYVRLPHWTQIKKCFKFQSIIQLKQKSFIQESSQAHLANLQKEYSLKHLEIKKTKKNFQSRFSEACRNMSNSVQEQEEIEKNIEDLILQYKEMKKKREIPAKLIKHEMKIKLAEAQLPTQQHKVFDAKYRLKELKNEAININISFKEFKEVWKQQFLQIAKGVVRSFLQNYYELLQEHVTNVNSLIVFEEKQILPQFNDLIIESYTEDEDKDIMVLIKKEKEQTVQIMNRCKQVENIFNQIWRYDGEVIGLLVEIKETFRKCQLDDTNKVSVMAIPLMDCGLQWVIKSLVEKEGMTESHEYYKKSFQQSLMIETAFIECKDTFQSGFKECEDLIKEKVTQMVQMFNGILKDSEKLSQTKSSNVNSFQESHKNKETFQKEFQTYRQEQLLEKSRINSQIKKCLELLEQHEASVSLAKSKTIALLLTLNRELLKLIRKAIQDFDQNFEDLVRDEGENQMEFKSPIPILPNFNRSKSIIQINGKTFSFDAGVEPHTDEKKDIHNKKRHLGEFKANKVAKTENYLISQLIKVFYLEWAKSIYFKEKFMEEMYLSLNKKRPKSLEEIIVTNIEIKGEPPQLLHVIPQKCSINQVSYFLFDFDISFRGQFLLEFETRIVINWPRPNYAQFPLTVKFIVKSLNGRIRVCYTPTIHGRSWFAFIGEPTMSIEIDPVVGKSQYNLSSLPSVSDIIREFLAFKIRKMTYPNKEKLRIPMAASQPLIPQQVRDKIKEFVLKWQTKQDAYDLQHTQQQSDLTISDSKKVKIE